MAEFDRRDFLKIVGAGAGSAAASGCTDPVQKLIPYVVQPEEITPGLPVTYASTCQECPAACGLHVRTRESRPIKLEGNPDHPINQGALCARGQAGLYRTYAPDRFQGPMLRGADGALAPISWSDATSRLAGKVKAAGKKTFVLGGSVGPTLAGLIDEFVGSVGGGRVSYEPFQAEALAAASKAVFGVDSAPLFDLSRADFIIDFGSDFTETGSPVEHSRQLAEARDVLKHESGGAQFVYVGPRLSQTAGSADRWLAAKPGSEGVLALAIARVALEQRGGSNVLASVLEGFDANSASSKTGVSSEAINELGRSVAAAQRPLALPPGVALTSRRAVATNAAVLLLNAALGAVGQTVVFPSGGTPQADGHRAVSDLIASVNSGGVDVLLIHDSNPSYSLPKGLDFAGALDKVNFVVSFASVPDETTQSAHLILPDHTPLESWGDAAPRPGVRSLVQPTIRPLYDTRSMGDTLIATGKAIGGSTAAALPTGTFREHLESAWSNTNWRDALARGGEFGSTQSRDVSIRADSIAKLTFDAPDLDGDGPFILLANPSPMLYDGRGSNLPVLQEIPDPVTSIMWQSWAEISRKTASSLGVVLGDIISLSTATGILEVPVYPRGGIRDDVIAVAIGQGHTVGFHASRDGAARGVNVIDILPTATDERGGRSWLSTRVRADKSGRFERMAQGQGSDNKRGRQLGDVVPLSALAAKPAGDHGDEHGSGHGSEGSHEIRRPYDAADDAIDDSLYRWGMTIDLDRCTGCSACVAACYYENNIPTVGEEGTTRSRTMSWLRIERYVGDGTMELVASRHPGNSSHAYTDHEELGELDIRYSPMLCQQCGAGPCEPVCPVFATYHAEDGLNGMIYNRCIGTRYCSNNCPYKVRRYNWFDYQIENWPEPTRLMLNPDVTVRGQGVMEKCTFCVQRIRAADQPAKDAGRPIADGGVTPACAQTCPTQAITLGNLRDEKSKAVQQARDNPARSYHALHSLNTRPAITYLSKVRRIETDAADGGQH
ncbi:MAG: 4Fe-4S dicluster domain-containing protein [Myxococcales bacterium]|nr:4Fe-4S dicluster domain-containing protein [Myxococcales bacterium]